MAYEDTSICLLKRWDPAKGVEHYAAGISGWHAWRVGSGNPSVVQLLPSGICVEPWLAGDGWQVLERAQDPEGALKRLESLRDARFGLLNYNCEHFARDIVSGKRESRQLQGAVLVACLCMGLVIAARS